jgi:hypothetical protein
MNDKDTQSLLAVLDRIALALEKMSNTPVFVNVPGEWAQEQIQRMADSYPTPHSTIVFVSPDQEKLSQIIHQEVANILKAL